MHKIISVGLAGLLFASPALAQQRGTVELAGFGTRTTFAPYLGMNTGWGGGGRLGAYFSPSLAAEFEIGGTNSTRNGPGMSDVGTWTQSARLTATPFKLGAMHILVGAGVDHVDTHLNLRESYGWHGLVGAKLALTNDVALRVDYVQGEMTTRQKTSSVRFGLSTFTSPRRQIMRVVEVVPGPEVIRVDSVSATETARLRASEAEYRVLRDSLSRPVVTALVSTPPIGVTSSITVTEPVVVTSQDQGSAMSEMIHFKKNESSLGDSAKAILRDKVELFRVNPDMRVVITGFTSAPGTPDYNMALGLRRATAAKEYLVFMGVDASRIEIASGGESSSLVGGAGDASNAGNRRSEFRLVIADQGPTVSKKY